MLHISYKDHVTNEKVRAKIQQAIGPHEDLLTVVKRRKLQWYGHVSRFAKSQSEVENRGKWRKLVAKSSVVPKRPSRLRN